MINICLIPARGGSKRIPRKNIKKFHGKPLIAWSIEAAKESGLFNSVYVSTDDQEIAEIAKSYGAIIPFLRPSSLSNDTANDKEVREHFMGWMKSKNISADILCYLYPTAPFVTKETLIKCRELLLNSGAEAAQTVTTYAYPALRALKKDDKGFLTFMWKEYEHIRSQDITELIHDAGQCYFFNLKKYTEGKVRVGYHVPRLECQDIDTVEDFQVAEELFKFVMRERIEGSNFGIDISIE